jgi:hypothetical protein
MLDAIGQLARVPTRHREKVAAAAALAGTVAVAQWRGRTSGSTRAERRRRLPGDELVDRPNRGHQPRWFPSCSGRSGPATTSPDGPPGTAWFVVERVDPPRLLVLHSTTHLPHAWRERLGAAIDWTWTFTLAGTGDGGRACSCGSGGGPGRGG